MIMLRDGGFYCMCEVALACMFGVELATTTWFSNTLMQLMCVDLIKINGIEPFSVQHGTLGIIFSYCKLT
jgi:hypothetical protein